jgi:hypothetical protein
MRQRQMDRLQIIGRGTSLQLRAGQGATLPSTTCTASERTDALYACNRLTNRKRDLLQPRLDAIAVPLGEEGRLEDARLHRHEAQLRAGQGATLPSTTCTASERTDALYACNRLTTRIKRTYTCRQPCLASSSGREPSSCRRDQSFAQGRRTTRIFTTS